MKTLFIKTKREGYSPEQCRETITVEELISYLEEFDGDTKVYLDNDNGYTYGSITYDSFIDNEYEEESEEN